MPGISDHVKYFTTFQMPVNTAIFLRFVEEIRNFYGKHPSGYGGWAEFRDDDGIWKPAKRHPKALSEDWCWIHYGSCD